MLCALVILERARGSASEWAPYIRILPDAYGGCGKLRCVAPPCPIHTLAPATCADDPFWWQPGQLRLLRGTRLGRAVAPDGPHRRDIKAVAQLVQQLEAAMRWVGECVCGAVHRAAAALRPTATWHSIWPARQRVVEG